MERDDTGTGDEAKRIERHLFGPPGVMRIAGSMEEWGLPFTPPTLEEHQKSMEGAKRELSVLFPDEYTESGRPDAGPGEASGVLC